MNVGIKSIAYVLGDEEVCTSELSIAKTLSPEFIAEKTGFRKLRKLRDDQSTSQLASRALTKLFQDAALSPDEVSCLFLVTQTPDGHGIPHVSTRVHQEAGLPKTCATFDIALGCSGYAQGLALIAAFMDANQLDNGVLITCDPYSKIVSPDDKDTALLFGDAASATLVSRNGRWFPGKWRFGTDGSKGHCITTDGDGTLHMNGRQVFNFSALTVTKCIGETLLEHQLTIEQIDKLILHQGSKYMVETIASRLGYEKPVFFASEYGNLVSSSVPVAFSDVVAEDDCHVLICGFGVGLAWASTILFRGNDHV